MSTLSYYSLFVKKVFIKIPLYFMACMVGLGFANMFFNVQVTGQDFIVISAFICVLASILDNFVFNDF